MATNIIAGKFIKRNTTRNEREHQQLQRQISGYAVKHHAHEERNHLLSIRKVELFCASVEEIVDRHLYRAGLC